MNLVNLSFNSNIFKGAEAMGDKNNAPNKPKWLYGIFLCFSLLFFITAVLVYSRIIDVFEKDIAWVFVGLGAADFITAFIFKSRYNDKN